MNCWPIVTNFKVKLGCRISFSRKLNQFKILTPWNFETEKICKKVNRSNYDSQTQRSKNSSRLEKNHGNKDKVVWKYTNKTRWPLFDLYLTIVSEFSENNCLLVTLWVSQEISQGSSGGRPRGQPRATRGQQGVNQGPPGDQTGVTRGSLVSQASQWD